MLSSTFYGVSLSLSSHSQWFFHGLASVLTYTACAIDGYPEWRSKNISDSCMWLCLCVCAVSVILCICIFVCITFVSLVLSHATRTFQFLWSPSSLVSESGCYFSFFVSFALSSGLQYFFISFCLVIVMIFLFRFLFVQWKKAYPREEDGNVKFRVWWRLLSPLVNRIACLAAIRWNMVLQLTKSLEIVIIVKIIFSFRFFLFISLSPFRYVRILYAFRTPEWWNYKIILYFVLYDPYCYLISSTSTEKKIRYFWNAQLCSSGLWAESRQTIECKNRENVNFSWIIRQNIYIHYK